MNIDEIRRERLKELRSHYKPMRLFAEAVGLPDSFISQMCGDERTVTEKTADKIETALDLPKGYMSIDPSDDMIRPIATTGYGEIARDNVIRIKQYSSSLSGGPGAANDENEIKGMLTFKRSWIERMGYSARELVSVYIRGNSMAPRIADGDTVLVRTDDKRLLDGSVYAINYDGDARCKRIKRQLNGDVILLSDNKDDPNSAPETIEAELTNKINVIGLVVHISGSVI